MNSIKFHPQHGTFVTAGGDGTYNFWDKDSKQRLKVSGLTASNRAAAFFIEVLAYNMACFLLRL